MSTGTKIFRRVEANRRRPLNGSRFPFTESKYEPHRNIGIFLRQAQEARQQVFAINADCSAAIQGEIQAGARSHCKFKSTLRNAQITAALPWTAPICTWP